MKQRRRCFKEILALQAPHSARQIESKLRLANRLAKTYPKGDALLYSLKHQLLAHLYSIPGYAPEVFEARRLGEDVFLSVHLRATRSAVHAPASGLFFQLKTQGYMARLVPQGVVADFDNAQRSGTPRCEVAGLTFQGSQEKTGSINNA
jgi:hypothetical protein